MTEMMRNGMFKASDLRLVESAAPADSPPLIVGEVCRLNSGSPDLLVVDVSDRTVTVAWPESSDVREHEFPRACVRRKFLEIKR